MTNERTPQRPRLGVPALQPARARLSVVQPCLAPPPPPPPPPARPPAPPARPRLSVVHRCLAPPPAPHRPQLGHPGCLWRLCLWRCPRRSHRRRRDPHQKDASRESGFHRGDGVRPPATRKLVGLSGS